MTRLSSQVRIGRRAARHGVALGEPAIAQLARHYDLLLRWNQTINLTALHDDEAAIDRLVIEPLIAARWLPSVGVLMDVGSGGGSPAVPLKVAQPGLHLLMVESKGRKAAFLREVVRDLGLPGAEVVTARLEGLAMEERWQQAVDVVSLRAVRLDRRLLERLALLLRPSGELLVFAGPGAGAPGLGPSWVLAGEHALLPALGSRLLRVRRLPTGSAG